MITDAYIKLMAAGRAEAENDVSEISTSTWEPPGAGGKVQTEMVHTWRRGATPADDLDGHDKRVRAAVEEAAERIRQRSRDENAKGDDTMQTESKEQHEERMREETRNMLLCGQMSEAERVAHRERNDAKAEPWQRFAELSDYGFDAALREVLNTMHVLLAAKRDSYGPHNLTKFGDVGVLVRAYDKIERLAHMHRTGKTTTAVGEDALDAWRDLTGYSLLMLVAHSLEDDG
jgi:hypothetical protein